VAAVDRYLLSVVIVGVAFLGAAVIPRLLVGRPLSLPSIYVALGFVVFSLPLGLEPPDPLRDNELTLHLTEIVVIVSLMGAGLRIDRLEGWRSWNVTWRLLGIAMPLTIAGVALLGWWVVGLSPAAALLLGAVIAPTDPVLASDVQVGAPNEDEEDDVRFALTSEAGLNDGLAFPFTNAAVAAVGAGSLGAWFGDWVVDDVVVRVGVGLVAGYALGKLFAVLAFRLPRSARLASSAQGFVALAVTLITYGVAELAHGYGFLAVFVAARVIRRAEIDHDYHDTLNEFAEAVERLLSAALLVLLGGAVVGGILGPLGIQGVAVGVATLVVVRPLAGMVSLLGHRCPGHERAAIAFFGIRGMGSGFYLAYALHEAEFAQAAELWAILAFVVLASIVLHGISASPVMAALDRQAQRTGATAAER
jgi:NhaP-type Na+/H+ or K+/H+ antiporter